MFILFFTMLNYNSSAQLCNSSWHFSTWVYIRSFDLSMKFFSFIRHGYLSKSWITQFYLWMEMADISGRLIESWSVQCLTVSAWHLDWSFTHLTIKNNWYRFIFVDKLQSHLTCNVFHRGNTNHWRILGTINLHRKQLSP